MDTPKENPELINYFANSWRPHHDSNTYSGWKLMSKITPEDHILDIGCGYNVFKKHLGDRIYGIDVANTNADETVAWEDYTPHKDFNVFFVLGSINFGSEEFVNEQIAKISKYSKPGARIYWRQNPGMTKNHSGKFPTGPGAIPMFCWSFDYNEKLAKQNGWKVVDLKWEIRQRRIYSEWIKLW
tara:strand:+ start:2947 stop:3498 length:552 start_codon:yes stop_codon:yes gene_type:complete